MVGSLEQIVESDQKLVYGFLVVMQEYDSM